MLKNMRVGTKLVAILVAPLVALGVLAGLGVADRLGNAADARRAESIGVMANRAAEAAQALQLEQLWATVTAGDGGAATPSEVADAYDRSVGQTDQALDALGDALDDVDDPGRDLVERSGVLEDRSATLASLRDDVRADAVSAAEAIDRYQPVRQALDELYVAASAEPVAPGIAAYLQYLSILGRAKGATAESFAHYSAVATGRLPASVVADELVEGQNQRAEAERRYDTFFEEADPQFKTLLGNVQASSGARQLDEQIDQVTARAAASSPAGVPAPASASTTAPVDVMSFVTLASERLQGELEVQREIDAALRSQAGEARDRAVSTVRLYLLGAAVGILAALGLAFLVARATTRPLRQLTDAANQLAGEQLPRLVERLRTPDPHAEPVRLAPIPIGSRDEIGQLAQAINQIQRTTTDVAEEQASLLRKGISDIFVNLARRNQALLDRQIEFIDQLEANEADPDQLDNLFRLDHLATRMRRNAESLLVLAGADPPRRRGRPVPLADVVRVAIGEVEDFARVNLLALDDVAVAANVAVDLSHVFAELMDNATQFSPPESLVEVVGHRNEDGSYVLSVSDVGIGMGAEQLAEANHELAHPPMMGLTLGRSLGFVVIGRLAARHGISVRLNDSASGGITALVKLPAALLEEAPTGAPVAANPWAPPAGRRDALAAPGAPDGTDADRVPIGVGAGPVGAAPPAGGEAGTPSVPTHEVAGGRLGAGGATAGPAGGRANGQSQPGEVAGVADPGASAPRPAAGERPVAPAAAAWSAIAGGGVDSGDRPAMAPGDNGGRLFSTSPYLSTPPGTPPGGGPGSTQPGGPVAPLGGSPGAWSTPGLHPPSSDGGQSFTYRDDGDGEHPSDTAWVARLLSRPADPGSGGQGSSPAAPGAGGAPLPPARSAAAGRPGPTHQPPPEAAAPTPGDGTDRPGGGAPSATPLPRRIPTSERRDAPPMSSASPTGGANPEGPVGERPGSDPSASATDGAVPGSAPSAPIGASAPPERPPATVTPIRAGLSSGGERGGELTAAGLLRRSPKQQIRNLAAAGSGAPGRPSTTQRSPEEVRQILSRYRTGLQRGRTAGSHPGGDDRRAAPESTADAEEQR